MYACPPEHARTSGERRAHGMRYRRRRPPSLGGNSVACRRPFLAGIDRRPRPICSVNVRSQSGACQAEKPACRHNRVRFAEFRRSPSITPLGHRSYRPLDVGDGTRYHRPHGQMHSSSTGPPHGEWGSGLPRMRWPFSRLRRLRVVPDPILLPVLEQWKRRRERWRIRQQRKAALVASRFVRGIHACRGANANANPRERGEASTPA